jgi:hypothetical protein
MAVKRPASEPVEVTPTTAGSDEVTSNGVTTVPALVEPDSPRATTADAEMPAPVDQNVSGEMPIVERPVAGAPVEETPAVTTVPVAPSQQVVYVQAPKPFIGKGNRLFGVGIAILATVIYAALYALAEVVTQLIDHAPVDFGFLGTLDFYSPVLMFLIGFILLVLIVNRAGWAAHVVGSLLVGVFVFFGSTGVELLLHVNEIPSNEVGSTFSQVLFSIGSIVAALLAREVALWMGLVVAARGRRVRARNVDARVVYDQEIAAKRAEYEQANARQATFPAVQEADAADVDEPVVER